MSKEKRLHKESAQRKQRTAAPGKSSQSSNYKQQLTEMSVIGPAHIVSKYLRTKRFARYVTLYTSDCQAIMKNLPGGSRNHQRK